MISACRGPWLAAAAALIIGVNCSLLSAVQTVRADDCLLDNCADKKPLPAPSQTQPAPTSPAQTPSVADPDKAAPKPDTASDTEPATPAYRHDRVSQPRGASQPGDFDFYVFSLSWSPGFCAHDDRQRSQCAVGANLGFVVHGLWPQYDRGFPSDCGPAGRYPSRIALQSADGLFPDEGLARYEWRKHGTCSGKSPTDYFADVRRAHDEVKIPPPFQSASQQQTWAPVDIERAFIAANPRLRPGMLAVACQGGTLQEVRICFSKDLRDFQACPEVVRSDCRTRDVSVPPMR